MDDQLVVSFRATFVPGRGFLDRAAALVAKLTVVGGVHVGWDVMKLTFAFEAARFREVLDAVVALGAEADGDDWAIGIAQGDLERFQADGSELLASGVLWWGPPIVAASALANLARQGEILCAYTVPALRAGELVTSGLRIAREGTLRVRGARIERRQPWAKVAVANVARMTAPSLVRAHWPAPVLAAGSLIVVRADPGAGGTRLLNDIAANAPRALAIAPAGSGFEPFGALRWALARREVPRSSEINALLSGRGMSLDQAAAAIASFFPRADEGTSVLLLDDVGDIDPATLEASVRAVSGSSSLALVARLDATSGLSALLATLPKAAEYEIATLSRHDAEEVAAGATGGALDAVARRRWARLGAGNPLATVEAVTSAVGSGEITWANGQATPRSRGAGRGKARRAEEWIRERAQREAAPARAVLAMVAIVGGEARLSLLGRALEIAGERIDVAEVVAALDRSRWLVFDEVAMGDTREPTVALPSRTYHKALVGLVDDDARRKMHAALASAFADDEGIFGRVEAAWHAARAGDGPTAAKTLLEAARATAEARLELSTTQLIAFARRADPSCEEAALELLASALERAPSFVPEGPSTERVVSIAPPLATIPAPAPDDEARSAPGSQIAVRLAEVAKEALLAADNAALERWVDALRAAGESPAFADRLQAMARLGRGDIGDALRVLRRTRAQLAPDDHRRRCQTSLALGVALSAAGRPQEALLEGMDALARAREDRDDRGAKACLAFLAKLYTSVSREADAERLRAAP